MTGSPDRKDRRGRSPSGAAGDGAAGPGGTGSAGSGGSAARGIPGGAPLSVRQPPRGYRYSVDAFLLADFAASLQFRPADRPRRDFSVLDLGTGSGIVLLLMARTCPALERGTGVEIQRELFECARRNIGENGFSERLAAVQGDFRERLPGLSPASFDLVVSNPPYRCVGAGRRNPDPGKEIARHEVMCTLPDLFRAAGRYLGPRGRFALVGLPRRLPEILRCAEGIGLSAEALRFVHPFPGRPANLLLFAGSRRGTPELSVLPPLVVRTERGRYHPDMERIYRGLLGE